MRLYVPSRKLRIKQAARLSLVGAALGLAAAVTVAPSPPATHADWDNETANFVTILNNYRQQNGRRPVVVDARLQRAADWMSNDQLNTARCVDNRPVTCDHTDTQGRDIGPRIRGQFGYTGSTVGENLLVITRGPAQDAFEGWRNSPGHNQNMLDSDWSAIGISRLCREDGACVWVNTFGSAFTEAFTPPTGGTTTNPTPPPPPTDTTPAVVRPWVGRWNTDRGAMVLAPVTTTFGNPLAGNYGTEGGSLDGGVTDTVFRGTWFGPPQADGTLNQGDFEFTLSADGNSFTGRFRVGASEQWDPWNGTRAQ